MFDILSAVGGRVLRLYRENYEGILLHYKIGLTDFVSFENRRA